MAVYSTDRSRILSSVIDYYREIFYKLNIIVIVHDIEGRIYQVNNKFHDILGDSANEIESLSTADFQTHESLEVCGKIIEETLKNGSTSTEVTLKKKNCETFPACIHTKLLKFDSERLILCVIDDISELKKAEAELRENNLFFDSIIENIPDMIFLKEAESLRFIKFNKSGEELLGYSRSDLLGKNDYDFFPKEEADFFTTKDREVLESGIVLEIEEEPIHTKNKGLRILHTKKIAIKDQNENPRFLMGISEDITERKRLEEIKRIRDLAFESSTNGILVTGTADHDYAIIHCNPAFLKMTGYASEEVLGKNCRFLQGKDRDQEALTELRTALREGKSFKGILRNYKKDGTLFWNELIVAPVIDDSGSLTHVVGILNDVTERKKGEDKLQKTYSELEIKIEKRTAELLKLNKILKSEIEVRASAEEALKLNVEQLSRKNRYEEIISTVTRVVHQSLDLNEVLENAVDVINKNVDKASIVTTYLVNGDEAILKTHSGLTEEYIRKAGRIPYGKGAVWNTILEGRCRYVPDVDEDTVIGDAGRKLGQKSYLAVPLLSSNIAVGVIFIVSYEKNSFDDEEIKLLKIVSQQIGAAINNAKQAEALKENVEQLSRKSCYEEIVSSVTQSVNQSTDLQEVMDYAAESMRSNIEVADHIGIYLVDGEVAVMKANRGYPDWFCERVMRIPKPRGFTWACINEGKVLHCPDAENDDVIGPAGIEVGTKSYVAIPLNAQGETIGSINLHSLNLNAFDKDDINLLEVVGKQIEIAINKSRDAEALRNSEERYRTIVENTYNLIIETDIFGNISYANNLHKDILGYDPDEMIGTNCLDLIYEDDRTDIAAAFQKAASTGESVQTARYRCIHKDGELRWLESTGRSYRDAKGEIRGVISSRDITDRKMAEDRRKEVEERNRALIENAYDIIVETTADGSFSYLNPTFKETLGYDMEEVLGKNVFEYVHDDDRAQVMGEFTRALNSFTSGNTSYRFRHKNGDWRWLESSGRPYRTASGEIRASITTRDITERKKAEEALRDSEERHRALIENTYDLIIEISPDLKYLYVSPNHQSVLGYEQQDLVGKSIFENMHPDDSQEVLSSFQKIALNIINLLGLNVDDIFKDYVFSEVYPEETRELWGQMESAIEKYLESEHSLIFRFKSKKGIWTWLESTGRPFWTSSGELRIVVSSRDITERKLLEDQLQKAFSEIERLKDQLEQENIYLQEEVKLKYHYGESEVLKSALSLAEQVANTESTVLIIGDTGTGKELLAHAIHNMSPRRKRPMITVNCANLPASLVETELFGREKGAFTGATSRRAGRFEVADGSTIFLDEIGELPLELQSKLLRVLQTGQFERIGGSSTISVNARVIAATNRDMLQAVEDGRFRQDLYYRLNVFPISLPPSGKGKATSRFWLKLLSRNFRTKWAKRSIRYPKR